jgi:hypothetical protein
MTSEAFKQRADAAKRRLLVSALGWPAEDPFDHYVARSGEMLAWLREKDPQLADQIQAAYDSVVEPYRAAQLDKLFRNKSEV